MPVKQQKKIVRKQVQKPTQKNHKKVGFFKRCADIAVVINLLLPVLISIFLIIALVYAVAKKNSTLIYPIIYFLLTFLFIIGITLLLYKYFPDALCVLFLLNLVFTFYTLAFVPIIPEEEKKA